LKKKEKKKWASGRRVDIALINVADV